MLLRFTAENGAPFLLNPIYFRKVTMLIPGDQSKGSQIMFMNGTTQGDIQSVRESVDEIFEMTRKNQILHLAAAALPAHIADAATRGNEREFLSIAGNAIEQAEALVKIHDIYPWNLKFQFTF